MVFIANTFAAWLFGQVANAGSKRVGEWVFGNDQERAIKQAATCAIRHTANDLCPAGGEGPTHLAMVIDQVFKEALPVAPLKDHPTLLQALKAGTMMQLAVLDDANLTGVGESSAHMFGLSGATVAESLTDYLIQEIFTRGTAGGPLAPLAEQLNHDLTHLQNNNIERMIGQLVSETAIPANASSDQMIAAQASREYGSLLVPSVPILRVVQDPEAAVPSFHSDVSILFNLIEEFVRLGVVDIALDAYRYSNVLPTLPTAFKRRIIEVDDTQSTSSMLQIITPIAIEQDVEITATAYGVEVLKSSGQLPDEVRSALFSLIIDLEVFIRGMRHGLLVALDLKRMRVAVKTLLAASRSQESRANLVTIEQVLSTYRPHQVGAVRMTSAAPARMIEIFEDLIENRLYRELSHHVPTMGLVGEGAIGVKAVTQAARRLADQDTTLRLGRYSTSLPSEELCLNNSDVSEQFNLKYFPPIVSMSKAIERAKANWQQLTPDIVPIGMHPSTDRFIVARDDR